MSRSIGRCVAFSSHRESQEPTTSAARGACHADNGTFLRPHEFLRLIPDAADRRSQQLRATRPDRHTMRASPRVRLVESRNDAYAIGDRVMGLFVWQEYAAATRHRCGARSPSTTSRCRCARRARPQWAHGVLRTASTCCAPSGETVRGIAAAGSVGRPSGRSQRSRASAQLEWPAEPTRIRLCVDEVGYDAAIDYSATRAPTIWRPPSPRTAQMHRPFFDNTSGVIHDAVLGLSTCRAHRDLRDRLIPRRERGITGPRPERQPAVSAPPCRAS